MRKIIRALEKISGGCGQSGENWIGYFQRKPAENFELTDEERRYFEELALWGEHCRKKILFFTETRLEIVSTRLFCNKTPSQNTIRINKIVE